MSDIRGRTMRVVRKAWWKKWRWGRVLRVGWDLAKWRTYSKQETSWRWETWGMRHWLVFKQEGWNSGAGTGCQGRVQFLGQGLQWWFSRGGEEHKGVERMDWSGERLWTTDQLLRCYRRCPSVTQNAPMNLWRGGGWIRRLPPQFKKRGLLYA